MAKRVIVFSVLSLLGFAVLVVAYLYAALFPAKYDATSWAEAMRPHIHTQVKSEEGVPVVFLMHGCGGEKDWLREERLALLSNAGYFAVAIDSFGARDVEVAKVCSGRQLWAGERLHDLAAAMDIVAEDPRADLSRFAVIGFSHGAWAALETFTGHWPQSRSPAAVVAYYPFCEFPNRARSDWQKQSDLLVFLAESDTITAIEPCYDLFGAQSSAQFIDIVPYAGAAHGFDVKNTQGWSNHYNSEYAADSWNRTLSFLASRLN